MRTFQEFCNSQENILCTSRLASGKVLDICLDEKLYKQIQTESFNAGVIVGEEKGMRKAADILMHNGVGIETVESPNGNYTAFKYRGNMQQAILSAAEKVGKEAT